MESAIQKLLFDMQLRGMSHTTQQGYSICVKVFQRYYGKPAAELGENEIREFLHYLIEEKKLSLGTVNIYNGALKFLYEVTFKRDWNTKNLPRLKHSKKLPAILSRQEVQSLFDATKNLKHKCMLMTIYSAGLRVSEVTKLKLTDIDSKNMQIFIREGKGKKDRYSLLSQANLEILREYWKKYKPSEWLFEGQIKGTHISVRTVQKVFDHAKDKAGIKKAISVHTLRHVFATHLLEAGTNLYHIKQLLGHTCIQTTCIYLHLMRMDVLKVKSPLDFIGGHSDA
jgi:site-specific recombinase XerD